MFGVLTIQIYRLFVKPSFSFGKKKVNTTTTSNVEPTVDPVVNTAVSPKVDSTVDPVITSTTGVKNLNSDFNTNLDQTSNILTENQPISYDRALFFEWENAQWQNRAHSILYNINSNKPTPGKLVSISDVIQPHAEYINSPEFQSINAIDKLTYGKSLQNYTTINSETKVEKVSVRNFNKSDDSPEISEVFDNNTLDKNFEKNLIKNNKRFHKNEKVEETPQDYERKQDVDDNLAKNSEECISNRDVVELMDKSSLRSDRDKRGKFLEDYAYEQRLSEVSASEHAVNNDRLESMSFMTDENNSMGSLSNEPYVSSNESNLISDHECYTGRFPRCNIDKHIRNFDKIEPQPSMIRGFYPDDEYVIAPDAMLPRVIEHLVDDIHMPIPYFNEFWYTTNQLDPTQRLSFVLGGLVSLLVVVSRTWAKKIIIIRHNHYFVLGCLEELTINRIIFWPLIYVPSEVSQFISLENLINNVLRIMNGGSNPGQHAGLFDHCSVQPRYQGNNNFAQLQPIKNIIIRKTIKPSILTKKTKRILRIRPTLRRLAQASHNSLRAKAKKLVNEGSFVTYSIYTNKLRNRKVARRLCHKLLNRGIY